MALDELLQKYGFQDYGELIELLHDLSDLTGECVSDIEDELDKIESEVW